MVTIYRFLFKKKSKDLSDFDIQIEIALMMQKSYWVIIPLMVAVIIFKIWLCYQMSLLIKN